jgi:hypothetical protein
MSLVVASARGRDLLRRRAGGVVHRGQRGGVSRLPEFRLARRAIYSLTIGLLLLLPLVVIAAVLVWKRSRGRER